MSRWQEQLDSHPIWETIDGIKGHLAVEFKNTDEDWFLEKRRLSGVIDIFESTIKQLDAETLPFNELDDFNSQLENSVHTQTLIFSVSGDIKHLTAANNQITELLTNFSTFKSLCAYIEKDDIVSDLNKQVDSFIASLSEEKTQLEENIGELKLHINNQMSRIVDLNESINMKQQETDKLISTFQDQFNNSQIERQGAFDSTQKEIEADLKGRIDHITRMTGDQLNAIIDDGEKKHSEILKIYGIVATDGTTTEHTKNADNEGNQANLWRWWSIGFIITTVAWLLFVLLYAGFLKGGTIEWNAYPTIISLTAVLLLGAGYTAQQSMRHRNNERKNRGLALRLAAFEPFVSSLDRDSKISLRMKMATILFGNEEQVADIDKETKMLIEALGKIAEKIPEATEK